MPIYEYECTKCKTKIEKLQKITDPVLTKCEKCDTISLKKIISTSSVRLKGDGWYETDFK